jgi:hypothetical protein
VTIEDLGEIKDQREKMELFPNYLLMVVYSRRAMEFEDEEEDPMYPPFSSSFSEVFFLTFSSLSLSLFPVR